jgi:hypothetical protein
MVNPFGTNKSTHRFSKIGEVDLDRTIKQIMRRKP